MNFIAAVACGIPVENDTSAIAKPSVNQRSQNYSQALKNLWKTINLRLAVALQHEATMSHPNTLFDAAQIIYAPINVISNLQTL